LGNWSIESGTSFSCPFAAGSAALYLSSKSSNTNPKKVREALQAAAKSVRVSETDTSLVTIAAQGAGELQLFDSINTDTSVSPTELLLNDTTHFNALQSLTITNTGRSIRTYKLSHVPAGTALSFISGTNQSNDAPVPQVSNAAGVKIVPSTLLLLPGETFPVLLDFSPPSGVDPKVFPIYSGFIQISGGSTTVHVPYLGVAASMKNMPIIDDTTEFTGFVTPTILDQNMNVQAAPQTYTFQNGDFPTVEYRFVGGTPAVFIDIVAPNAKLGFTPNFVSKRSIESRRIQSTGSPSPGRSGLWSIWCQLTRGKGFGCGGNGSGSNTFNNVPIIGNAFEMSLNPRNNDGSDGLDNEVDLFSLTNATFTNGTTIPNGTYKFLLRALHITGDPNNESDYEAWLSEQTFTVAQ